MAIVSVPATRSAEVVPLRLVVGLAPSVMFRNGRNDTPGPFGDVIFVHVPTAPEAGNVLTPVPTTMAPTANMRTRRFISPPRLCCRYPSTVTTYGRGH